ncbi:MAG: OmpA family protein [Deferrisomatales bacterium]|nr:OmpA family protein [Deferrisomatales bacterium]
MKRIACAAAAILLGLSGCAGMETKTGQGAAVGTAAGAAVGAGLGQAIGRDTKSTLIGAAIGAAAGGLTGAAVGSYMDRQEEAMRQALAESEAASVRRELDVLSVTFKGDVSFDVNSAALKPGAQDEVARVARVLNQYLQTTLLVAGHTDSTGAEEYNQRLSERRADSVKNALVGHGVAPGRVTTVGYGPSRPIADNATPEGRQLNRRVEIRIEPQQG